MARKRADRMKVFSLVIDKKPRNRDTLASRIACLGSPRRKGRLLRLGPDRRLKNLSEQLDLERERERDKKRLSFQGAGNLIDRWGKISRDKEALMRKRNRSSSSEKSKSSHLWKPSSNIASIQPVVGDMRYREAGGQRTHIFFAEKSKSTLDNTIRIRERANEGVTHTNQNEKHPSIGIIAIRIRSQAQEGPAHSSRNGKHPSPRGYAIHEQKQNDARATHADQDRKHPLRKHNQDFSISPDASKRKDANDQACTWVPTPKPIQVRSSSQGFDPLKSNGKHKLDNPEPSTRHKKGSTRHRRF